VDSDVKIWIDDAWWTVDDLTFGQQRKMRDYMRQLAPNGDTDEASMADLLPAFVTVVKQIADNTFTLEQSLELRPSDLVPPQKARAKK
jgi:hypothetical protein